MLTFFCMKKVFTVDIVGWLVHFLMMKTTQECQTLEGLWYNQYGSQLILKHLNNGALEGEYRTAVEIRAGSAGNSHSIVVGSAPFGDSTATFGFSVVWNGGESSTVWVGQCMKHENGHEQLVTTWLIQKQAATCNDRWMSVNIGQDVFTRYQQRPGPRKQMGTHVPERPDCQPSSNDTKLAWRGSKSSVKNSQQSCRVTGVWYNDLGSEMILNTDESGIIKGEYRTAVEREKGTAGSTHSNIFGVWNVENSNSTVGLIVVWRKGSSATGFVGQCHRCHHDNSEVLEVAWLLRVRITKYNDSWKSVHYGQNSFTRHAQKPGPRKADNTHTPIRDGEDSGQIPCSGGHNLQYGFELLCSVIALHQALVYNSN